MPTALPLVDALPVVVYQVQPEPPYAPLYVSAGASALGCPREEWLATPDLWMRMLHPDDRARVLDATARAMRAGGTVDYEYRLVGLDGVVRWVHDRGAFVRDAAGRAVAWQGVMLDVSARRAAEAALHETEVRRAEAVAVLSAREARFRALVDHAQDVVGVLAPDGTILYESPAVERVLGFRPEELEGRSGLEFVHPDDAAAVEAALAAVLAAPGTAVPVAYRCRHGDGTWRTLEGEARNLVDIPEVGGVVVNVRDVTRRRALEARLIHQATHDALTGLANRALFRDRVEHALARPGAPGAPGAPVAVLFLDLDDFKEINDSLGHEAGDDLLRTVATRLLEATRGSDTVARLGGDEFAVLLPDPRADADVLAVAERITAALGTPVTLGGHQVRAAASIGIARARPGEDAAALLRNADLAMYTAKRGGRGRHAAYEPAMHAVALARLTLQADLRAAIERSEFHLVYQPVVELGTGRIVGAEALVRWQHPTRGLVSPAEFIPVAEDTGLIVPIGRWVLEEACRQAAAWRTPAHGRGPAAVGGLRLSVNLSSRQLEDPTLVPTLHGALLAAGLAPERLTLEITESVVMRDTEATLGRLAALKALGVQLAIDDFGTGYSSLAYLQRFPVDVLKIDKRFVDGVASEAHDAALARTIVALGAALGLSTVAEGIETAEQDVALRALGCRFGQGHRFARPLAPEALAVLLRAGSCRPADT